MKLHFIDLEYALRLLRKDTELKLISFCPNCDKERFFYRPLQFSPRYFDKTFCSVCGWYAGHRAKVSERLRQKVFETDNYECVYCGSKERLTLEHIIPHSHGGLFKEDNLLTACKSCNSSRCNRDQPAPSFGRFLEFADIPF